MRTKDFRKRREGVYGPGWERVRRLVCFWKRIEPDHRCAPGYTSRHTAHHWVLVSRGGKDVDGLLPCCGQVHDLLHDLGRWPHPAVSPARLMDQQVRMVLGIGLGTLALEYSSGDDGEIDLAY